MARINRTDVIQKAVNDLAISQSGEKIPNETLDKVQLTYSLNKQHSSFVSSNSSTTSGTSTITPPSVSTGGEIYVTHLNATYVKDATCDIATGSINVALTPDASGISTNIFRFPVITLTAQSDTISISLAYPIKIKAGTTITMSGTFTAGVMSRHFAITGFTTTSN